MKNYGVVVDAHTVRFERVLPGPIDRVWDYLVKPEFLSTWLANGKLGPGFGKRVELRFDVEEVPARKKKGSVVRGRITHWNPPSALEYTWMVGAVNSIVAFKLEPMMEDTVKLVLTHRRLPPAIMASVGAGWHTHLAVLTARLHGDEPELFLAGFTRLLPVYKRRIETSKRLLRTRTPILGVH